VDSSRVIAFPRAASTGGDDNDAADVGAAALAEIDAAIALVVGGAARRVRLTALPFVDVAAALALAHARAAGLGFRFERPSRAGVVTVTIGPLEPDRAS
jgi:hypothetical protein